MYTTTITTEGRKQVELFENSYDVNYQIFNKERMTEKIQLASNLFAEGEADGDLDKQDPVSMRLKLLTNQLNHYQITPHS